MKRKLFNWLFMLVAAITCVGFTSCDSDEEIPGDVEYPILGTWKLTTSSGYTLIVFNSNGSGTSTEYSGGNVGETDSFRWVLVNQKLTITYDGSGDTDIYEDVVVQNGKLYCTRNGETICFENCEESGTNPDNSKASIVGAWQWTTAHGNGDPVITITVFNADGTGTMTEYDMGKTMTDNILWHLYGNKLTITYVYDDKESRSETYDIVFISNDILYWNWDEEADYWYRIPTGPGYKDDETPGDEDGNNPGGDETPGDGDNNDSESGDEEKPDDGGEGAKESPIVGTWRWDKIHNGEWRVSMVMVFYPDGSGTMTEYENNDGADIYRFKWALEGNKLTITYLYEDGDSYTETYDIVFITNDKLYWNWDREADYWYRQ